MAAPMAAAAAGGSSGWYEVRVRLRGTWDTGRFTPVDVFGAAAGATVPDSEWSPKKRVSVAQYAATDLADALGIDRRGVRTAVCCTVIF